MKLLPPRIEEQVGRVDKTPSLIIGIGSAVTALWCVWQLFWLLYTATVLSSVGWSPVSVVFPFILWTVVGAVAGISAYAFLTHYAKQK